MKEWFTALELEQLALQGLPSKRRAIAYKAERESWKFRERAGRGGGREYWYRSLPDPARRALVRALVGGVAAELPAVADPATAVAVWAEDDVGPSVPVTADPRQGLAPWRIEAMEARAALVGQIEARMALDGMTAAKAIEAIVAALAAGADPILDNLARAANARAGGRRLVSRGTLFAWYRAYLDGGMRALAPKAAPVDNALPAWASTFLKLYCVPSKPSLRDVLERMERGELYDQARRLLKAMPAQVRERGRSGPRALRAILMYRSRDTSKLLPGDVYTSDGHTFKAEVGHPETGRPIRPEVTGIVDVATRRMVGWSAALKENTWGVLAAMQHAFSTSGICTIWYVDNGKGFNNSTWDEKSSGLLDRLGVTKKNSIPYNSQARGLIERSHQSCWVRAAKLLATYVGDDMDDEARHKVFKETRAAFRMGAVSALLPTWRQFMQHCAAAVAAYNARPHSALPIVVDEATGKRRHQSPDEAWAAGLVVAEAAGCRPEVIPEAARDWFYRPSMGRIVQRGTVRLLNNVYSHPDLVARDGEAVLVGFDIHDARLVWVQDQENRLICVAEFEANKTDYFPQSVIQQARERRGAASLARLAAKREAVIAEMQPAPLRLIGEPSPDALPSPSREPLPEIIELKPRRSQYDIDTEVADRRFLRWLTLDARLQSGGNATDDEREWHATYQTIPEWSFRRRYLAETGDLPSGVTPETAPQAEEVDHA